MALIVCVTIANPSEATAMSLPNAGHAVANLEIDLVYVNGDRADYHGIALKIYQDNSILPFETISSLTGNPYIISLPLGHQYKIESYASSMLASIGYVNLDTNEKLKLGVPVPGSIQFTVLYNDGYTPVDNATVMIKSMDGTYQYWTNSTTDDKGSTIRFWLQPTIFADNFQEARWLYTNLFNDNYYKASVFLGNSLSYNFSQISVLPGLSSDIKIITPWPAVLPPVTVSVYKSAHQPVSKADGNFAVQLYDDNGKKISESNVDSIGKAIFSDLKVGRYFLQVVDSSDENNSGWDTAVILDGKQNSIQIFKKSNNTDEIQIPIPTWVKSNADKWSQNQANDSDFISSIQYLVQQGIVNVPPVHSMQDPSQIPSWIKSNAAWWAHGQISDNDFIKGIEYMISNGILKNTI